MTSTQIDRKIFDKKKKKKRTKNESPNMDQY